MPAHRDRRVRVGGVFIGLVLALVSTINVPASADNQCHGGGGKQEDLIINQTNNSQWYQGQRKITVIAYQYVNYRNCYKQLQAELYGWDDFANRFALINYSSCYTGPNNEGGSQQAEGQYCSPTFVPPADVTLTSRSWGFALTPHDKDHKWDKDRTWWGRCARYIGVIDRWIEYDAQNRRPICGNDGS